MSVLKYFDKVNRVWRKVGSGGGGGTDDYLDLENKPKVNGVTLAGNKNASDLGLEVAGAVTMHKNDPSAHAEEIETAVSTHDADGSAHSGLFIALSSLYATISHNHTAGNITSGILGVEFGGTGRRALDEGRLLVGSGLAPVGYKSILTEITPSSSTSIPNATAVKNYVNSVFTMNELSPAVGYVFFDNSTSTIEPDDYPFIQEKHWSSARSRIYTNYSNSWDLQLIFNTHQCAGKRLEIKWARVTAQDFSRFICNTYYTSLNTDGGSSHPYDSRKAVETLTIATSSTRYEEVTSYITIPSNYYHYGTYMLFNFQAYEKIEDADVTVDITSIKIVE